MKLEQLAVDAGTSAAKLAANTVKDVWSVMDAAAEKPSPAKSLGQRAIASIQGAAQGVEKVARTAAGE